MLSMVAKAIRRYVTENFNDLLNLDMHLARLLGAPAPYTLSAYSYKLELEGKLGGKICRPIIDKVFGSWIMGQTDHCKNDYLQVTNGLQGTTEQDQSTQPKG